MHGCSALGAAIPRFSDTVPADDEDDDDEPGAAEEEPDEHAATASAEADTTATAAARHPRRRNPRGTADTTDSAHSARAVLGRALALSLRFTIV